MWQVARGQQVTFGISREDEEELRTGDKHCLYCGKLMKSFAEIKHVTKRRADQPTIEHLNSNGPFYTWAA